MCADIGRDTARQGDQHAAAGGTENILAVVVESVAVADAVVALDAEQNTNIIKQVREAERKVVQCKCASHLTSPQNARSSSLSDTQLPPYLLSLCAGGVLLL